MINYLHYKAINWNVVEDELDNATWERATSLFWLDNRIPIEEDKNKWNKLTNNEQDQLNKLLALLANLSTFQSINAGEIIRDNKKTQQEIAIVNNLQFTEMVNTKAYNRILNTFNQNIDLTSLFNYIDNDPIVISYLHDIDSIYIESNDPLKKRFMAICIEGIINYAYLAYPLDLWTSQHFDNLGKIVEMIIRNESLHCFYLSHKINILLSTYEKDQEDEFKVWVKYQINIIIQYCDQLINQYYNLAANKTIAINLVRQEANKILEGLDMSPVYQVNKSTILNINNKLNKLCKHSLISKNFKKNISIHDEMINEDYNF